LENKKRHSILYLFCLLVCRTHRVISVIIIIIHFAMHIYYIGNLNLQLPHSYSSIYHERRRQPTVGKITNAYKKLFLSRLPDVQTERIVFQHKRVDSREQQQQQKSAIEMQYLVLVCTPTMKNFCLCLLPGAFVPYTPMVVLLLVFPNALWRHFSILVPKAHLSTHAARRVENFFRDVCIIILQFCTNNTH
jgi:hypothetical protein